MPHTGVNFASIVYAGFAHDHGGSIWIGAPISRAIWRSRSPSSSCARALDISAARKRMRGKTAKPASKT
jgi:hypothetical protein